MKHNLLTVAQAANLKGVSRAAIYGAIARGRLPHQRILEHIALREADVGDWVPMGHKSGRPKGIPMSAAAKASLSQAQKQRWAQRKQVKPPASARGHQQDPETEL